MDYFMEGEHLDSDLKNGKKGRIKMNGREEWKRHFRRKKNKGPAVAISAFADDNLPRRLFRSDLGQRIRLHMEDRHVGNNIAFYVCLS